jgi:hypothetical protein
LHDLGHPLHRACLHLAQPAQPMAQTVQSPAAPARRSARHAPAGTPGLRHLPAHRPRRPHRRPRFALGVDRHAAQRRCRWHDGRHGSAPRPPRAERSAEGSCGVGGGV